MESEKYKDLYGLQILVDIPMTFLLKNITNLAMIRLIS